MKAKKIILATTFFFFVIMAWMDIQLDLRKKEINNGFKNTYYDTVEIIQEDFENQYIYSSIKVMSIQEMVAQKGGCSGGGTCEDYDHECVDCTTLSANQCSGGAGNCVNDGYVPVCRCSRGYVYIQGCK